MKKKSNKYTCKTPRVLLALSLLVTTAPFAQLANTKMFSTTGPDHYKHELIIDSLGQFFEITDSAGKHTVYMGEYNANDNIISFRYKMPRDFKQVLRTEQSPPENDSLVKITLLSCLNHPIPADFAVDAIQTDGKFAKAFVLNEKGEIFLDPNKYSCVRLTGLDHYFYGNWAIVNINHANQRIFLSFPEQFFSIGRPLIWFLDNFSALIKADGLYDLQGKNNLFPVER